ICTSTKGHTCWLEISIENLLKNTLYFLRLAHKHDALLWPVLKANSYGLNLQICGLTLLSIGEMIGHKFTLCVHRAEEGVELAKYFPNYKFDIFVLSPAFPDQLREVIKLQNCILTI